MWHCIVAQNYSDNLKLKATHTTQNNLKQNRLLTLKKYQLKNAYV